MDNRLLEALANIGTGLEILSEELEKKRESDSAVLQALSSGDFGKQLESISVQLKSIKSDTQKILNNQNTIIKLSEENKSGGGSVFEGASKNKDLVKDGAMLVISIAGAVLAMGLALKLIGDVKVSSVIALTVSITLISLAMSKVYKDIGDVDREKMKNVGIMLAGMSAIILVTSFLLSKTAEVSPGKLLTAAALAGSFSLMSPSIVGIVKSLGDVDAKKALIAMGISLLVMPMLFLGVAISSHLLALVNEDVSPKKVISALLISGVFVVLSYSISKIMSGIPKDFSGDKVPILFALGGVFVALSFAVSLSSLAISKVSDISFGQFLTSLGVSVLFVAFSFALKPIMSNLKDLDIGKVFLLASVFATLSLSVAISSHILAESETIEAGKILNIILLGIGISVFTLTMYPAVKLYSKMNVAEVAKGSVSIVLVSTAIMASSRILSLGVYEEGKYPNLSWATGVGLSLLAFGGGAVALGSFIAGPQALLFLAGIGGVLSLAGTIVGVSHILKKGDYDVPNMLEWAKSVSLLYITFTPVMIALGAMAMVSAVASFFGPDPWVKAKSAIEDVAKTIVSASSILSDGYIDSNNNKITPKYSGGPTKEWAEGVSLSIGAFSMVYEILTKRSGLFNKSITTEQFVGAIDVIARGIVSSASVFAEKGPGIWVDGPTKEWAEGVSLSIGAFSMVYEILTKRSGLFSKSITTEQFVDAIDVISRGIIQSGLTFRGSDGVFSGGYPSKGWSEGVGAAIAAFSPAFELLSKKNFWRSDKSVISSMSSAIMVITDSIIYVNKKLKTEFGQGGTGSVGATPSANWSSTIEKVFDSFTRISEKTNSKKVDFLEIKKMANNIGEISKIFEENKSNFSVRVDPDYIENISKLMTDYSLMVKKIEDNDGGFFSKIGSAVTNFISGGDPITLMSKGLISLSKGYSSFADSVTKLANAMKMLNMNSIEDLKRLNDAINVNISTGVGKEGEIEQTIVASQETIAQVATTNENYFLLLRNDIKEMITHLRNIDNSSVSINDIMEKMAQKVGGDGNEIKEETLSPNE
jgi:hypothetical protein